MTDAGSLRTTRLVPRQRVDLLVAEMTIDVGVSIGTSSGDLPLKSSESIFFSTVRLDSQAPITA